MIPCLVFDKFPQAGACPRLPFPLTTQIKNLGEAMAIGRTFMDSRHGFTTAHWDQESKAPASRTHSKRFASLWNVETARQRLECVELAPAFGGRFMGSLHRCLRFTTFGVTKSLSVTSKEQALRMRGPLFRTFPSLAETFGWNRPSISCGYWPAIRLVSAHASIAENCERIWVVFLHREPIVSA